MNPESDAASNLFEQLYLLPFSFYTIDKVLASTHWQASGKVSVCSRVLSSVLFYWLQFSSYLHTSYEE